MKILVLLFKLIFFLQHVNCNDKILSKFHQNSFKVKDVRIQLINYSKEYFRFFNIQVFKYNRTTTAHNGTFNLKVSTEDKLEIVLQAYKFLSNEYRHFPIRFQVNLKKAVDSNAIGLGRLHNCGNITRFFFYKDITYYSCNFIVDETRFPPLIPNGKYKWHVQLLHLNHAVALVDIFHEIYIPVKYPKK